MGDNVIGEMLCNTLLDYNVRHGCISARGSDMYETSGNILSKMHQD